MKFGSLGGRVPSISVNFLSLKYLLISKKRSLRSNRPKIDFCGVHLGIFGGWHPQTMSKYLSVVSVDMKN